MAILYAPYLVKSKGTCKPGERADLTGCAPASGEASSNPQKFRSFKRDAIKSTIDKANQAAATVVAKSTEAQDRIREITGKDLNAVKVVVRKYAQALSRAIKGNLEDALAWAEWKWEVDPDKSKQEFINRIQPTKEMREAAFDDTIGDWLESGTRFGSYGPRMLAAMEELFLGGVRDTGKPEPPKVAKNINFDQQVNKHTWEYYQKASGTCKQGERSDLTGCTPATEDAPSAPKPKQQTATNHPVADRLHSSIDGNSSLSPEQKSAYKQATTQATSGMPPKALERIQANLKEERFYPDQESMARGIAAIGIKAVKDKADKEGKPIDPKVLEAALDQLAQDNMKKRIAGCYSTGAGNSLLHLDGGGEVGNLEVTAVGIYTHELTHAIDGPNFELSNSKEFERAYYLEIWGTDTKGPTLSRYAWKDQQEGFAEFGRLLYTPGVDLKQVMKKFPTTSKYFKSQGLWPKGAK